MMWFLFFTALLGRTTIFVSGDSVTTSPCIEIGQDVVVGFENIGSAMDNDWIGIYRKEDVEDDKVPGMPNLHPLNWVFSCNSRDACASPWEKGPVLLSNPKLKLNANDIDSHYVAVLARFTGSPPPYNIVSKSASFRVAKDCTAPPSAVVPTELPTPSPTGRPTNLTTRLPTPAPINLVTSSPSRKPISLPTTSTTGLPTPLPTAETDVNPITDSPTPEPSTTPSMRPTRNPTENPTINPTESPTRKPSDSPTKKPSNKPTFRPTVVPTRQPTTALPTNAPTPTQLLPPLRTSKRVYTFRENIEVIFNTRNPEAGDWIGIYRAATPLDNLRDALFWIWNCDEVSNSPNCGVRASGTVTFSEDKNTAWAAPWPPVPGQYKAVLIRDGGNDPWDPVHVSPMFEVGPPTELNAEAVSMLRKELEGLIVDDITLASKFLRLGFHDCVGGCDGCVDLDEIKNRGLEVPLDALDPVVDKWSHLFSRADVWAMSTLVGADVSQPRGFRVDFAFDGFGRLNCEDIYDRCFNKNQEEVPCDARHGPAHFIPGVNINTHDIFEFFDKEFDFNQREAVAIMGAHTLGQLSRKNSGVDGQHGWLLNNRVLDNEYYVELVGGRSVNSPRDVLINDAPNWVRHFESNSDMPEFDDNHIWLGTPEGQDGRVIIMLNADIAIVRDLNDDNMKPDGEVTCSFVERDFIPAPVCPHARGALEEAARYRFDNDAWLKDFEEVCKKMMRNGYRLSNNDCLDRDLCKLEWQR